MSKIYRGSRSGGEAVVYVRESKETGPDQLLDPRLNLANHSPDGLEWGYNGSGPAQLALALVADVLGEDIALSVYQEFKRRVVANLPAIWSLTEERVWEVVYEILV